MKRQQCALALIGILSLTLCGCGRFTARTKGIQIIVKPDPVATEYWTSSRERREMMLADISKILEQRTRQINGISKPKILTNGDTIEITLPGAKSVNKSIKQLFTTGNLEFYYLKDVRTSKNPMGKWSMQIPTSKKDAYIFTDSKGVSINSIKQPKELLEKVVQRSQNKPILTGKDLIPNAQANINDRQQVVIQIKFNSNGTSIFRTFTKQHVDDILAIFYNDRLITAPTINEVIPTGSAEISGFMSLKEARDVAQCLNAGPLPVPVQVTGSRIVSL